MNTKFPNSKSLQEWWVSDVWGCVESALVRWNLSPNQISVLGLVFCFMASLALGFSYFILGAWALLISTSFDFLDGRVARRTGQVSSGGSFLDSVLDRYADFFVLAGLSYYFKDQSWLFLICLLAILGSMLTPYIRAKAESLGIECNEGMMQRPQRIAVIGISALICGIWRGIQQPFEWNLTQLQLDAPLILGIGIVALFSLLTAFTRFGLVFRRLSST